MSNRKQSTLYVYLLNPAREYEQDRTIYMPVDVWRDLLFMTGIGLFFGVGKGSNIDATGTVLTALGVEDKRGQPLVERGPRNIPPPPDQEQNTGEPYPGLGLHRNAYCTRAVVALSKVEAEVIGKMLRTWAHLEAARTAEIAAQPERALITTRKRRQANEEHIETGRASQWTVPPHQNWIALAQQLGEWLCVQTPDPSDIYIGMRTDALEQAVRIDQGLMTAQGPTDAAPEPEPSAGPDSAQGALLARLHADLPGNWSDGGARGALLWLYPFAIAVSQNHGGSLTVIADHLELLHRRAFVGWGGLRRLLAELIAETVYHRLWAPISDDSGPAWAHAEVRKKLVEMRAPLTEGYRATDDAARKVVAKIDRMLLEIPEAQTDAEAP